MESMVLAALCGLRGLRGESSHGRSCILPALPSSAWPEVRLVRDPDNLNATSTFLTI